MSVAHSTANDHHRSSSTVSSRGLGFLNEVFVRADVEKADPDASSAPKKKTTVASIAGVNVPGYVSDTSTLSLRR